MIDSTAQLVDDKQRHCLLRRFGSGANDWLERLPSLVDELATEWKLTIEGPAPHGRTSVVLRCTRVDGSSGILKVSPDPGLGTEEARVLRLWEDSGRVPQVWEIDADRGAVLLEAIGTGRTVALHGEVPPMEVVGSLIAELHAVDAPPEVRRELSPLCSRMGFLFNQFEHRRAMGPAADLMPAAYLHHGHARARALADGDDSVVMLHADLHPGNVLDGGTQRGLVAVDPRACIGDAAADTVDWVLWQATSHEEVERRAATLASVLGLPPSRLLAWARACAPMYAITEADSDRAQGPHHQLLLELAAC